jgi:O-antigen ligase
MPSPAIVAQVSAMILSPLAVFASKSPAWVFLALGFFGLFCYPQSLKLNISKPFILAVSGFFSAMIIGCLWAVDPLHSLKSSFSFLGLCLAGVGIHAIFNHLSPEQREKVSKSMLVGLIISLLFILGEWLAGNPWVNSKYDFSPARAYTNVSIIIALFFWPAVFYFQKNRYIFLLLIFTVPILLLADTDASVLGILGGGFVVVFWRVLKPFFGKLWFGGLATCFIVLPLGFKILLTDVNIVSINEKMRFFSYVHRLYVWQSVSRKIQEYNFMGAGMDSSRLDSVGGDVKRYHFLEPDNTVVFFSSRTIPLHPHNIPLQIWLELGFLGVGTFLWAMWLLARLSMTPQYAATLTSMTAIGLVSVGAWQSWWISTLIFVLLFCLKLSVHHKKKEESLAKADTLNPD